MVFEIIGVRAVSRLPEMAAEMAAGMGIEEGSKAETKSIRVRLFVGGLAPGVSSKDLAEMLDRLGRVHSVDVPPCKQVCEQQPAGSHRGFAYVEYEGSEANLAKLMSVYNGCKWRGGKLRIERAKEQFLSKLQREWDADSQAEADDAAENSSLPESSDTLNLKRPLSSPGLNMRFPNAKKLKFVPLKGLGKHKYSFRREESLPLHLLPLSIDEKLVVVPRQQHSKIGSDAGPQRLSKIGAVAGSGRSVEHQLNAEELEESLKVERQKQLELLSKLFPSDADFASSDSVDPSSSTKEVAELPTNTVGQRMDPLPRRKKKKESLTKHAGKNDAKSVASPWAKLFEAAAGVGVKSDISDSEMSNLEEGGDEEGGDDDEDEGHEDVDLARDVVDDEDHGRSGKLQTHSTSKKVTWKGLDEHHDSQDAAAEVDGSEADSDEKHNRAEDDNGEAIDLEAKANTSKKNEIQNKTRDKSVHAASDGAGTGREDGATSPAPRDGTALKRATVPDITASESQPSISQKRSRSGSKLELRQAPAAAGESKEEKWNRLFAAAAYVPASDLVLNIGEKMETVPGEPTANEPSPPSSGPILTGIETKQEKWRRVFEVAAGGTEPSAGQAGPERKVVGDKGSSELVLSLDDFPKAKAKNRKAINGASDAVKAAAAAQADRQSVQASTDPGIDYPQAVGGAANGSHPGKVEAAGAGGKAAGEADMEKAESGWDPATQALELDREARTNPTDVSEVVGNSRPASPPPPSKADDENAKWMQKASWKSLVGDKGVVGFSLGRTLGFNFLQPGTQVQPQAQEQEQKEPDETSPTRQPQPETRSESEAPEAVTSPPTQDAAMDSGSGPGSGEVCTFMRSESAHRDWAASRARLKADCKAKHKAAMRQARKMRPPPRLL